MSQIEGGWKTIAAVGFALAAVVLAGLVIFRSVTPQQGRAVGSLDPPGGPPAVAGRDAEMRMTGGEAGPAGASAGPGAEAAGQPGTAGNEGPGSVATDGR